MPDDLHKLSSYLYKSLLAAEDWCIPSSLKRTRPTQGKDEATSFGILIAPPTGSPLLTTSIWHPAPELGEALKKVSPEMSPPAERDSRKSIGKFWDFWI